MIGVQIVENPSLRIDQMIDAVLAGDGCAIAKGFRKRLVDKKYMPEFIFRRQDDFAIGADESGAIFMCKPTDPFCKALEGEHDDGKAGSFGNEYILRFHNPVSLRVLNAPMVLRIDHQIGIRFAGEEQAQFRRGICTARCCTDEDQQKKRKWE